MTPVELAPEVTASLRATKDHGAPPPRCHSGLIHSAVAGAVRQLVDDGRSGGVAEKVKNVIYDGATPYSTYVRGVIVDGDRGVLLTGRDDSALIIEG